jgi:hypothetical protein
LTLGSTLTSKISFPDDKSTYTNKNLSLQYQNRKAEYFSAIWDIINWKAVEKRFS